jgi:signal transduction histidine kinase/CheY-like chemotaxis protein
MNYLQTYLIKPAPTHKTLITTGQYAIFAALFLCVLIFSGFSQAQITRVAKTVLEPSTKHFHLGPSIYITKDSERKLNLETIVERHEHNLRGERQTSDIINLGIAAEPVWMVFSVINNSKTENWVFNFGNIMDGRVTAISDIIIYDYTARKTLLDTVQSEESSTLQGTVFEVQIPRNQEALFVAYVVPEGGLANTMTPYLMRQNDFLDNRFFIQTPLVIATCLFIFAIGFFSVLSFFARSGEYLWFSGYYGLHFLLFISLDNTFIAPFSFFGEIFKGLFLLTHMVGLSQSKTFLSLRDDEYGENFTILSLNILMPICFLLSLFVFSDGHIINNALVLVPPILVSMALCILSFVQAQKGKYAGHYFAIGWAITTFGVLITTLTAMGLLQAAFFTINAYWIFLVLQAFCFALGCLKKSELVREEIKSERARQNRAEQSLVRLKQSKESADQARLLRVIERERELMADLREREMQRTEEMRIAKEIADEANRAKSAFLAVVSHEIRTPMTGIMGIVRLMADTKMSKEQNDYILTIQKSGDTMMALLNDILDFEKIETGNMRLEEIDFDLPKLIQGVVMLMSGHAADKKVTLKSDISEDCPRFLVGDPTRLRQVLLNMASNAIKFTEHGSVTIRLRASLRDESAKSKNKIYDIYFAVEDTGVGISEEAQRNLFNPFEQADVSISRKYGGTGLGLAICQRLVEAMGSAIQINSQPGQGSTFHFTLTLSEGDAAKSTETDTLSFGRAEPGAPVGLRILVVEDNEINRKVLQNFLEKDHHHVVVSESGEEAIEICSRDTFDIIFTDINLTGMTGLETARTIRTMPSRRVAQTPIVAITGNVTEEDRKRCKDAGINDLLGKPIDYESLRKILANLPDLQKQNEHIAAAPAKPQPQQPAAAKPADVATGPGTAIAMPAPDKTKPADATKTSAPAKPGSKGPETVYSEDSAVAPIHAYLKEMKKSQGISEDYDEDTFSQMLEGDDTPDPTSHSDVCDFNVLQGLLDALGKTQVEDLLKGYIEKADEIIKALDEQQKLQNVTTIKERAHELKGMAANFGIIELSQIAGRAEKAAQNKDLQSALQEVQKLPFANQKANIALKKWLESAAKKA